MSNVRFVKTMEGAQRFKKGIGSVISNGEVGSAQSKPVSLVKLKSLQAQILAAQRVGNTGLARAYQRQFFLDLRVFKKGKSDKEVLAALRGGAKGGKQRKSN